MKLKAAQILKLLELKRLYGAYASGERYGSLPQRGFTPPPSQASSQNTHSLESLIHNCSLCNRIKQCKKPSFGLLRPHSELCFISEVPLIDENGDFVSNKSALMLQNIIKSVFALPLERVSVLSLVKCGAHNPHCEKSEILACMGFVRTQLELCAPKVCILLGQRVGEHILGQHLEASRILWHNNAKFLITHSLNELVRNPSLKARARDDFLIAKGQL